MRDFLTSSNGPSLIWKGGISVFQERDSRTFFALFLWSPLYKNSNKQFWASLPWKTEISRWCLFHFETLLYLQKSAISAQSNSPLNLSPPNYLNVTLWLRFTQQDVKNLEIFISKKNSDFGNHFQNGQFLFLEIFLEIKFGNNLEI